MCVCSYVCIYVSIYVYVHVYLCMCICIMCIYVCVMIYVCVYMFVYIGVWRWWFLCRLVRDQCPLVSTVSYTHISYWYYYTTQTHAFLHIGSIGIFRVILVSLYIRYIREAKECRQSSQLVTCSLFRDRSSKILRLSLVITLFQVQSLYVRMISESTVTRYLGWGTSHQVPYGGT